MNSPRSPPRGNRSRSRASRTEWIDCLTEAHRNFAAAVLDGATPAVDAESGTRSVELANAIYLSSVEDRTVELPLERGAYLPVFEALVDGGVTI